MGTKLPYTFEQQQQKWIKKELLHKYKNLNLEGKAILKYHSFTQKRS